MRKSIYIIAFTLLAAQPACALTPMLPHDVINGCFPLKPGQLELTADGVRGVDALIQLISPNPERIIDARVTLVRTWPLPGSTDQLFLADANYQSFSTTKPDSDWRMEGRIYGAGEASNLVAALLPKELTKLHKMAFSEMRSSDPPRCDVEIIVEATLSKPPGPYYLFGCDAQGCRKEKEL